jgi:K+-transporting ATPase KdpF subunit
MKYIKLQPFFSKADVVEAISYIWYEWQRQKLPLVIFLGLCLNLLLAPCVYAATGGKLEPRHTYALGALGLVTLALVIYLFDVVFRPERY